MKEEDSLHAEVAPLPSHVYIYVWSALIGGAFLTSYHPEPPPSEQNNDPLLCVLESP